MFKKLLLTAALFFLVHAAVAQTDSQKTALATIDPLFEAYMRDNHVPGLVFGVVMDGKLAYVRGLGVQDIKTRTPVTQDTVFRIASMSKNFTALAALKLRDEGKLSLDMPAELYIAELAALRYPTSDSARITVRDLLSHSAGFVNDDPWGDRQLAMSEADFSRLLKGGVPFSRSPGQAYEYSNFGYALVGRLVTNVSGRNYADYITASFLNPLGMTSTRYDLAKVPAGRRAIGYRWEGYAWIEEPVLGPGVFGAMGGVMTTASDYARFIAWQLAAWPPRDEPEDGILKRASIREIQRPGTYAIVIPGANPSDCPRSASYGMGVNLSYDCVLGFSFGHSGGLPGYGSNMLMLRDRGVGIFAFTNRTYAGPSTAVRQAAIQLVKSGAFPLKPTPPSQGLQAMAPIVAKIYAAGDILAATEALAMNVLLDRDAAQRNSQIAVLKKTLGACGAANPINSDSAMSATLTYPCEHGTLRARVALAPTIPASLQTLDFQP